MGSPSSPRTRPPTRAGYRSDRPDALGIPAGDGSRSIPCQGGNSVRGDVGSTRTSGVSHGAGHSGRLADRPRVGSTRPRRGTGAGSLRRRNPAPRLRPAERRYDRLNPPGHFGMPAIFGESCLCFESSPSRSWSKHLARSTKFWPYERFLVEPRSHSVDNSTRNRLVRTSPVALLDSATSSIVAL